MVPDRFQSQLSWLSVILGAAAVIVADNIRISKNVDMLCSRSLQFNNPDIGRLHRGVLAEDFERTRVIFRGEDEGLLAHFGATFQCGSINCGSVPAVLATNPLLCRLVPRHWPYNASSKKFSGIDITQRDPRDIPHKPGWRH